MKKYVFLFAFIIATAGIKAQELSKTFEPQKYATGLTEKIVDYLQITNQEKIDAIQKQSFNYAMAIQKYIIMLEQEGKTNGKKMDELIEEAKSVEGKFFKNSLKKILHQEEIEKLKELNIF